MKKTSLLTRLMTIACMATLIIIGCKKENSQSELSPQQEEQAASISTDAETQTEFASNDVFDNVLGTNDNVGMSGIGIFGRLDEHSLSSGQVQRLDSAHCFTVTAKSLKDNSLFPLQVVIDFGNGCLSNGHWRKGKVITVYTGRIIEAGKSATTTFEDYTIDSLSISGTHIITNTTSNNQRQFTVDITNGKLSLSKGNYIQWNSHKVLTQTEGNGTPLVPFDDIFTLTGTSNGKVKNGDILVAYNTNIETPLKKKFTCHWITEGVIKVKRETLSANSQWVASINYGNGDCDNKAVLTINGTAHQIILH